MYPSQEELKKPYMRPFAKTFVGNKKIKVVEINPGESREEQGETSMGSKKSDVSMLLEEHKIQQMQNSTIIGPLHDILMELRNRDNTFEDMNAYDYGDTCDFYFEPDETVNEDERFNEVLNVRGSKDDETVNEDERFNEVLNVRGSKPDGTEHEDVELNNDTTVQDGNVTRAITTSDGSEGEPGVVKSVDSIINETIADIRVDLENEKDNGEGDNTGKDEHTEEGLENPEVEKTTTPSSNSDKSNESLLKWGARVRQRPIQALPISVYDHNPVAIIPLAELSHPVAKNPDPKLSKISRASKDKGKKVTEAFEEQEERQKKWKRLRKAITIQPSVPVKEEEEQGGRPKRNMRQGPATKEPYTDEFGYNEIRKQRKKTLQRCWLGRRKNPK